MLLDQSSASRIRFGWIPRQKNVGRCLKLAPLGCVSRSHAKSLLQHFPLNVVMAIQAVFCEGDDPTVPYCCDLPREVCLNRPGRVDHEDRNPYNSARHQTLLKSATITAYHFR